MDDGSRRLAQPKHVLLRVGILVAISMAAVWGATSAPGPSAASDGEAAAAVPLTVHFPPAVIAVVLVLLTLSAFFSGSETALFSLQKSDLRTMRQEPGGTGPRIAAMMEDPGRLLTNLLVGNITVNVTIAVVLGLRVERYLGAVYPAWPAPAVFAGAVAVVSAILVVLGELLPKILAVGVRTVFARTAVYPLALIDKLVAPARDALLGSTNLIFRLVRFHQLKVAPFMTTEEFKAMLDQSEAQGVIEEDERNMIQGILDITDSHVREILVPRPDVVALAQTATVREALALYREHGYSRMPVYDDDLDHVMGLLVCKDLLPSVTKGELDRPIKNLARAPFFVPETMTIYQFVKDAQRRRKHLAIVVDEYGGTRGLVTLEDAIEEVVGEIVDEGEESEAGYEVVGDRDYRVEGWLPLDDLSEIIGVGLEDEEHETVAGFLMNHTDKVPEPGDQIEYAGVLFTVERVEGKRAESLRVRVLSQSGEMAE